VVACEQSAFQVSQYIVETLFRWGGKCLHYFAANLFGNYLPNFIRIARVLWKILQRKHFGLFLSEHSVVLDLNVLVLSLSFLRGACFSWLNVLWCRDV